MKKLLSFLFFLTTVSFVPGCAQLGLAPAQSIDQQIAYAYTVNASVRSTAADLLTAKTINMADAKMVLSMTDQVRSALDIARVAVAAGIPKDAQSALTLANDVLTQVQVYLAKRKGGS